MLRSALVANLLLSLLVATGGLLPSSQAKTPTSETATKTTSSRFEKLQNSALKKSFAQALALRDNGEYVAAIDALNSLIRLNYHSPQIFFERGLCNYRLGRHKDALADFNKTIELDDKYEDAYIWLVRTKVSDNCRYDGKSDWTALTADLNKFKQKLSGSQPFILECSLTYRITGKLEQATALSAQAVAAHPENIDFRRERAYCLAEKDDALRKAAVSYLNKQIAKNLKPSANDYYLRALLNRNNKNIAAVRQDYQKALSLAPLRKDIRIDAASFEYGITQDYDRSLKLLQNFPADSFDQDTLNALWLRAHIKEQQKNYREATADYTKLIALYRNPIYIIHRAQNLIANKQWQEAATDIKSYLDTKPDDTQALSLLYRVQMALGQNTEALASLDKAMAVLNRSPKSSKPAESFLEERAELYVKIKEPENAIRDLQLGTKLYPNNAHFWHRLGQFLSTKNQNEQALDCFNRALKIDPKLKSIYYTKATTYITMGQVDNAIRNFKIYSGYYPQAKEAFMEFATMLAMCKRCRETLQITSAILRLDPNFIEARNLRINCLYAMDESKKADAELHELKSLKNLNALGYCQRGNLLELMHQYDEARSDYQRAINMGNYEVYAHLISLLLRRNEVSEAMKEAQEWQRKAPQSSMALAYLGQCYNHKHDYPHALRFLNKSIELNPNNVDIYLWRADLYLKLKDSRQSLKDVNRTLQMAPNSTLGYKLRATIYRDFLHQNDLAKQDLATLKKLDPE